MPKSRAKPLPEPSGSIAKAVSVCTKAPAISFTVPSPPTATTIVLHADGGELVEIYDVMGQLLHIFNAVCGENRAEVGKNCVVLIKIRNKISKIVL